MAAALLERFSKIAKLSPVAARRRGIFPCGRCFARPFFVRMLSGETASRPAVADEFPHGAMEEPLKHPDYFEVHKMFTVKDLFEARVHLGHKEGTLNDHMRPFIFGSRLGHLIIDLDQTAFYLRAALNVTAFTAFQKGIILFVNKNPQNSHLVERTAMECGEYAHARHWFGGVLTNINMERGPATRLPDLVILIYTLGNVLQEHLAVPSAAKMLIPSVGIVDTNCDPRLITYPVPGNDDTPSAARLYCKLFKQAILKGKQKRKELDEKGIVAKDLA